MLLRQLIGVPRKSELKPDQPEMDRRSTHVGRFDRH